MEGCRSSKRLAFNLFRLDICNAVSESSTERVEEGEPFVSQATQTDDEGDQEGVSEESDQMQISASLSEVRL